MTSSSPPHPHTPRSSLRWIAPHKSLPPHGRPARPWAVTVIGWLLLLEVAALLFLAFINLSHPVGVGFLALAVLALAAAFGFVRMRRGGWVNAVLLQGGGLLIALWLYFSTRPMYAYIIMLVGIVMVLYLHQADVQSAFRQAPGPEQGPP